MSRLVPAALITLTVACGARTPLDVPSIADAEAVDSTAPGPGDSSLDVDMGADSTVAEDVGVASEAGACESLSTMCDPASCGGIQQSPICCAGDTSQEAGPSCTGCSCGCETELDCTGGCANSYDMCCFVERPCGSGGTHWVASCQLLSNCGPLLCDPGEPDRLCYTPCTADTTSVGIPPNSGYGQCMWSKGP